RLRALPVPGWFRALFEGGSDAEPPVGTGNTETPRQRAGGAATGSAGATAPARLHLLDTITSIDEHCADGIIVSGSHGGLSSTGFVLRAPVRPRAVFLNDAGVGRDNAGI